MKITGVFSILSACVMASGALTAFGQAVPAAAPDVPVVSSASNLTIALTKVAGLGTAIIDEASKPGPDPLHPDPLLYVMEESGTVVTVNPASGAVGAAPFLQFPSGVLTQQGVAGMTFAPGYDDPTSLGYHKLYTFETETPNASNTAMYLHPEVPTPTGLGVLREWTANADGKSVSSTSSRVVLSFGINNTAGTHIGGGLKFGPDGFLYLSTGDSGDGGLNTGNGFAGTISNPNDGQTGRNNPGDSNYVPGIGNGEDFTNMLGKVIRIDPLITNLDGTPITSKQGETAKTVGTLRYFIPDSNPFANNAKNIFFTPTGPANVVTPSPPLAEIYAFGFRNPWKLSFDALAYGLNPPANAVMNPIVSAVGSSTREALDLVQPGKNYGWPYKEGSIASPTAGVSVGRPPTVPYLKFDSGTGTYVPYDLDPTLTDPSQMQLPLAEYTTRSADQGANQSIGYGSAITGGFIYRGTRIPFLYGKYVFGDYELRSSGQSLGGELFYIDLNEASTIKTVRSFNFAPGKGLTGVDLLGFAEGSDNELYAMFANGDIRLISAPEPASLALMGIAAAGLLLRRRAAR